MSQAALILLVKVLFAGLAVVAVAVFLVRPVLRMLRTRPDPALLSPTFELPEEEPEELEIPADQAKPDRHAILEHARGDARQTALLVSRWLRERK